MMKDKKFECCMVIMLCMPVSTFAMQQMLERVRHAMISLPTTAINMIERFTQNFDEDEKEESDSEVFKMRSERHFVVLIPPVAPISQESVDNGDAVEQDSVVAFTEYDDIAFLMIAAFAYMALSDQATQRYPCPRRKIQSITAPLRSPTPPSTVVPYRTPGTKLGKSLLRDGEFDDSVADGSDEELTQYLSSGKFRTVTSHELVSNQASTPDKACRLCPIIRKTPTPGVGIEWDFITSQDFELQKKN